MPAPFRGIRGEAISYIPALIEQGWNNSQIVNFLRDYDLSYRTQNMYADINRLRLEEVAAATISGMDLETPIPERLMREWHGDTEHPFRVVIKYEYFDTNTLTTGTTGTTLYFDQEPTQAEVLDYWEVHKETIKALYNNVQEIYDATKIEYFRNVK